MALDCDATLTLKIHIIQHLSLHILTFHRFGVFQQTVGQGTLSMINMGNNTKIADILHLKTYFLGAKIQIKAEIRLLLASHLCSAI